MVGLHRRFNARRGQYVRLAVVILALFVAVTGTVAAWDLRPLEGWERGAFASMWAGALAMVLGSAIAELGARMESGKGGKE